MEVWLLRISTATGSTIRSDPLRDAFNREVSPDGKTFYPISKVPQIPYLSGTASSAEKLTFLGYAAFAASPALKVCPGAVLYRNRRGGTICTTAFQLDFTFSWMQDKRKIWLEMLLDKLNGKKLPYISADFQPVMLLQRKRKSGGNVLGIFNLGFDPMDTVSIRCAKKPARAEILQGGGRWKVLSFKWEKGIMELPVRLECYEPAVIRISPR